MGAPAYDVDRYIALLAQCTVNVESFRGTLKDFSRNQINFTKIGSPRFVRDGAHEMWRTTASGDRADSVAIAAVVDVTAPFWIETVMRVRFPLAEIPWEQAPGNGGFYGIVAANGSITVVTTTAAGAAARSTALPAGSVGLRRRHVVLCVNPVTLMGLGWLDSVPTVIVFTNTGVPANTPLGLIRLGFTAGGLSNAGLDLGMFRVRQGIPVDDDVSTLYKAYKAAAVW